MENTPCSIPRWALFKKKLNNLPPSKFKSAIEAKDAIVIDVRTEEEFQSGSIKNAINLDYLDYKLIDKLEALDPDRHYYVYCRTERRSIRTCTLMQNGGFKNVYNLDGGLLASKEVFTGVLKE